MARECMGAEGIGLGWLQGGGNSGWVRSARKPNTESMLIPFPIAHSLISAVLSNIK